jgi:hypothetical protein
MISETNSIADQVLETMDGIRNKVWHDPRVQPHWRNRLTSTAGLRVQQQRLAKLVDELRQACRVDADACVSAGDISAPKILAEAVDNLILWQRELEFQRQWIIVASSAQALGHVDLARRLARVYRLLYGGNLRFEPIADPLALKANTVFGIARILWRWIWDCPIRYQEWDPGYMQFFDVASERIDWQQTEIRRALRKRGLLENPLGSSFGRRLYAAYEALSFESLLYSVDELWLWRIFAAFDEGNLTLACALMRLYGHMFGTVYLIEGEFLDRPTLGEGHVPDAPTPQEAKRCLFECNRLRALWVERKEEAEAEEAALERLCKHATNGSVTC